VGEDRGSKETDGCPLTGSLERSLWISLGYASVVYYFYLIYIFTLDFPWLCKCCVLFLLDLYIYFGFPLARLKWSSLLKLVRLCQGTPAVVPARASIRASALNKIRQQR
jgi:hypothetical protein